MPTAAGTLRRQHHTFDIEMLLNSDAIAASAEGKIATVAKVFDTGSNAARFRGRLIVDVKTLDIDAGNEIYRVCVQGSSNEAFADTIASLGEMELGAAGATVFGDEPLALGRYEIGFCNAQNGKVYRYIRVYVIVAGAGVGVGLDADMWIARDTH